MAHITYLRWKRDIMWKQDTIRAREKKAIPSIVTLQKTKTTRSKQKRERKQSRQSILSLSLAGLHIGTVCWPHLLPVAHRFWSRRFTWRGRSGSRRFGIRVCGGGRGVSGSSLSAVQPALILVSDAPERSGCEGGCGVEGLRGLGKRGSSN
jgi:hypothetical protein